MNRYPSNYLFEKISRIRLLGWQLLPFLFFIWSKVKFTAEEKNVAIVNGKCLTGAPAEGI